MLELGYKKAFDVLFLSEENRKLILWEKIMILHKSLIVN